MSSAGISNGSRFLVISFFILLFPVLSSFYKYFYSKNYDYLIETNCDPQTEICFSRDCSIPDTCPPNEYEFYKQFYVKAYDFAICSDNSCEKECKENIIQCVQIPCGESPEDVCTQLPS